MSDLLAHLRDALADRYLITGELGRGGMATVFLAEDRKFGRQVAIKVLNADLSAALGAERFQREIHIASRLTHLHILPVYDSGEAAGALYYVMPYIEGESLRDRITRERQLPIEDAVCITIEVAEALAYAHAHGLVHRDIKPENILLSGGHAVVADFGIARAFGGAGDVAALTQTGVTLGTPTYMSPEQATASEIDGRTDQYSLGCVAYEMLTGQPPFTAPNAAALMARHALDPVPLISTVRPSIPEDLEDTILRTLEKVPADRYATLTQFAAALRMAAPTGAFPPRTTRGQAGRATTGRGASQRRRIRRRAVVLAAGLVPLVVGALYAAGKILSQDDARGAVGPDLRRVAVTYLRPEGTDSALSAIADGLTEALIDELGSVAGLRVVPAGGVAPYRGSDVAADSIAKAVGAGVVVDGTVEAAGPRLRVNLRLADGEGGGTLFQESVAVPRGEFLAARDSVVEAAADMLRRRLDDEITLRERRASTADVQAWVLLQRVQHARKTAQDAIAAGDRAGAARRLAGADSLATLATARDPRWAEPFIIRSTMMYERGRLASEPGAIAAAIDSGLALADSALAREPRSAGALEMRGILRMERIVAGLVPDHGATDRLLTAAEADLQRAVALDRGRARAWNALSELYYLRQRPVESNRYARNAYEADAYLRSAPAILWRLWATSYDLEQFVEADHWCGEGRRRFPDSFWFARCDLWQHTTIARTPADPARARQLAARMVELSPPHEREYRRREGEIVVAASLARAELRDSARAVLVRARADKTIDRRGELIGYEAFVRTILGDRAEAIQLLQLYLTNHPEHREGFAKVNAWWWRGLADDPRFKALAAR
ncbi:MAG TPA: serine/threonine-protein kinase [Gemmatimonadaceae bacterium]|nr:serine/threonine-protein kinase [Gemmatimonadaceae bacterium]